MPEAELSLMFLRPLNKLGERYIVSGSVAAILYGEPRFTNDVDLVVFLRAEDIPRLREAFPTPEFYVPPPECVIVRKLEFYREGGSDKHLRDIRTMLAVSGEQLDHAALKDWITRHGVAAQWAKAKL